MLYNTVLILPYIDIQYKLLKGTELFLALLGVHCCSWAVPSWGEQRLLCSCSASRCCSFSLWGVGSRVPGLSTHGTWAEPHGHVESSQTRDQTMSPTLAGRFLTTGLPGKPSNKDLQCSTGNYIQYHVITYNEK